ncbi:hypothetical protein PPERSA_01368 [Pseudocohnilembus persalinus]|uniref:Transmembrane protein n=1 Tax=Pseudocohnilembus persalinus TaxID=266149 RepID=A0A0V0QGZ1_PSEPJ|nr:hypothetical protein PPERSA_01368 [Pseudocohnilembus persalinus]|eukprot:KRX01465.1 hypothetical protein PPERSA_01368 [Pseudocohnilembus persalinus]
MYKPTLIILILALLTLQTQQVTYAEFYTCLTTEGLTACYEDVTESCADMSSVDNSDQCQYIQDNGEGLTTEWSEEFGENWHGCMNNCLDELSGDDATCLKDSIQCSQQRLVFAFLALVFFVAFVGF